MNILTTLWGRIRNYIFPQGEAKKAFNVTPVLSKKMEQNINLWYSMYINEPPWMTDRVRPLGLPAAICREIARPTMVEFQASISGSKRADFLNACFQNASDRFLRNIELGLALGGVAFKPYISEDKILIDATSAAAFQPSKFNAAGTCTGGVFKGKPVQVDGKYYILLEYHDLENGSYVIKNKAYRSDERGSVSSDEVPLSTVPEWADIQPEVQIDNLTGPLFSYFKTPLSNNIDMTSSAGISVYSGAVAELIREADAQWEKICWEYYSGRRKVLMDGNSTVAAMFDRDLFEIGAFTSKADFYQEFSPEFRDEPLYRGFQNILKQIEFNVGLSYGTISDPQTIEKTATEIRNSKQRMYVTVNSIQKELDHTFDSLIYAMDVYASLYSLTPEGNYTATYDWGDSVLDDAESKERERANDRQDLAAGIMNDWEYRSKWYGEDEQTAKAMLPKAEEMVDDAGESEIE